MSEWKKTTKSKIAKFIVLVVAVVMVLGGLIFILTRAEDGAGNDYIVNSENSSPEKLDQENLDQGNLDQEDPDQDNSDQDNPGQEDPDQDNSDQEDPDQDNPDQEDSDQSNPDQENPDQENLRDPSELMEGIIRYEATEGMEDIGLIYFKDITSMDDIGNTIEGYSCVKNQLLLTAKEGTTFAQIEDLAHSYDAEIVGCLELVDYYQIEFYEEITPERLQELKDELAQDELIERCDYNLVAEISPNVCD